MTNDRDRSKIEAAAWVPTADYLTGSRLVSLCRRAGVGGYHELLAWAAKDVGRYWDAVASELDLVFHHPYSRPVDLSRGLAWPEWFVDGGFNYVANALDRNIERGLGEKPAVLWVGDGRETRSLTFDALQRETHRFANSMLALGLQKGDRVGILLPMIPEAVISVLACGLIGAVYIPMFSGYGEEAVASRLTDCGAKVLITADGFNRRGARVQLKQIADAALSAVPSVEHCIVVDHVQSTISWVAGRDFWWHELIERVPDICSTGKTAANDPYMIIYTSGTTGKPKGAVHMQSGFPVKAAHDLAFCFDLRESDNLFWLTDLGWMMGPWLIAGGLLLGATITIFEGAPDYPNPDRIWQIVARHGITVLGIAPTAIRALMAQGDEWINGRNLTSLRVLGSTGEPWNPSPWWWYFEKVGKGQLPIINYSGGTETGGGIVGCVTTEPIKPCCFNGPVPGMDADVVDSAGKSVRGKVGELVIRQPWVGMTRGFWNDNQRYLDTYWSRFDDVWVHGDWAEVHCDGYWFIRGRSDDTLKVAGKRIGPAEVESAAVAHESVQEAAAIGVPDEVKGECVVVFCVLRPGVVESPGLAEEIRQGIAQRLGAALRPRSIVLVKDLPRTRNAKIMRRVIRASYLGLPSGDVSALENPAAVEAIAAARTPQ
jgi:acetyl-CoA synthetase